MPKRIEMPDNQDKRDGVSFIGKREEITDLIDPKAYDDPNFKAERKTKDGIVPGIVLKFQNATIKITKIDRKNKRCWGEHIKLVNQQIVGSHHGHDIDSSKEAYDEYGEPFCRDCQVLVGEDATEDGEKKALDRLDEDDEPEVD